MNTIDDSNGIQERTHIFINVIERLHNPLYKIKLDLTKSKRDEIVDIKLSKSTLAKILDIEYSGRRRFRFFYYKSVFLEIQEKLDSALIASKNNQVFIYLTDEGVWSELLKSILRQNKATNVKTVMAQHGLHFIEKPPSNLRLRYLINKFLEILVGYPSYGYGYAGSNLDYYLVYSADDRNYINAKNKSLAFSCPKLLKYDFLEEYNTETHFENENNSYEPGRVLFAMEPIIPMSGVSANERDLYEKMGELFRRIVAVTNNKILFRPHPGMNVESTRKLVSELSYSNIVTFDSTRSLNKTLAAVDFVMSLHSTVLFDALLVGKVPIQVITPFDNRQLHTKLEIIDIDKMDNSLLVQIFSQLTIANYSKYIESDDIVWSSYIQ